MRADCEPQIIIPNFRRNGEFGKLQLKCINQFIKRKNTFLVQIMQIINWKMFKTQKEYKLMEIVNKECE